ncbi:MAG TPA: hypothetical protein VHU84_11480 [Lacipirellulaceae bacterium]|jgi:hypothetical protein|nr:hypothetical protein [Lacipirellulaceae bacterium]
MIEAFILLVIAAIGIWMTAGSIIWAVWYARRSLRSKRLSLWSLFFAFTVVTLLIGAFSAWLHVGDY